MSAFFISMREHICNFISPAKATKPSNTFDCHKLKAAWQFRVIGFRKMAHFHKFSNAKIITMKCAPLRTNPTTNKDQINSNQLKRQPQSIWKFLWVGCFVTTCVRVCLCLFVDILCKFQLPLGGSTRLHHFIALGTNSSQNRSSADIFYLARIASGAFGEVGWWKHCNMAIPFCSRSLLKGPYWLPSACRLPCSCCCYVLPSSAQFSLVWFWFGSFRFGSVESGPGCI